MNFDLYGFEHMVYIYIMALCCVLVPLISNKFLSNTHQKSVAIFLVVSIIGIEIIDDIYRIFDSSVGWDIKTDLPLHMCGFSVFATSWACLLYTSPSPRDRG